VDYPDAKALLKDILNNARALAEELRGYWFDGDIDIADEFGAYGVG
jgi:hypothetical protein